MKAFQHVYEILAELAPRANSYLGVGVQEGLCVASVVRANPQIDLVLCDTWGPEHGGTNRGSHDHVAKMLRREGHLGTVRFLDGDSHVLLPTLPLGERFDLSYVDGDHTEGGAYADLMSVWARTRWAMIAHDMSDARVLAAYVRLLTNVREGYATLHVAEGPGQSTVVLYRGAAR